MYKLYSPDTEMDLAFIKSLLEADGLEFYVHNDHFGSLELGPKISLFNAKTIFVREEDSERAKAIIANYLEEPGHVEANNDKVGSLYTLKDRLRVIFETLLFWWFIPPGRRWRRSKQKNNKQESLTSHST